MYIFIGNTCWNYSIYSDHYGSVLTSKVFFCENLCSMKYIYDYFRAERNMIVVTLFLLIMNQTQLCLVLNQKENCHYDHIPLSARETVYYYLSVI